MRRTSYFLTGGASLVALGALVACGGGSSTTSPTPIRTPTPQPTVTAKPTPTGSPSKPTPTASPTASAMPTPTASPVPTPTVTPRVVCTDQALPGTYTSMVALGNYNPSSGQFTGDVTSQFTTYAVTGFVPASPSPTPVPTPTPTPLNIPVYLWSGVYSVSGSPGTITNGCFAMVVTQNGQPISPSSPDSGSSIAYPKFAQPFAIATTVPGHIVSLSIATSPTGGVGTFSLDNSTTGTIVLHARRSGTLEEIRRFLQSSQAGVRLPF